VPAAILARSVVLEARRGGLPWLVLGALAVALAFAAFVAQVALTESVALQLVVFAAVLRACAVFLIAAQVTASALREIEDKGLELVLSLPISRAAHYLGRLAGFTACGALMALVFAAPLLFWAPPAAVALWGVSLAFESALIAAAALFFAMTLAQFVPALAATVGLYLLARSIGAIQAIADGAFAEASPASRFAQQAADAIALVMPNLDEMTRTAWLLYEAPPAGAYAAALASAGIYIVLLSAAGLFDFYRRSV
jgi:ABC-type Na+ efflux pump permease subunit